MITSAILNFIYLILLVITSPLRLIPDVSLPSELSSAITTANTYFQPVNILFPINSLFTIFFVVLIIEGGIFIYKGIMWALKKIPGLN
jgi:hypothetical protein